MFILAGPKYVEKSIKQHHQATLLIVAGPNPPKEIEIINFIMSAGYRIRSSSVTLDENATLNEMTCEVWWRARLNADSFDFLKGLTQKFGLAKTDWRAKT